MCEHADYHTGSSRYDRVAGILRFVLVCDQCGAVTQQVDEQPYRPDPVLDSRQP